MAGRPASPAGGAIGAGGAAVSFHPLPEVRGKNADLRSIVSMLALCATLGTTLDLEAVGDDEQEAAQTLAREFGG